MKNYKPEMTFEQMVDGAKECCERGLLTCTRGKPGAPDATYALGWLPLDNPEQYSEAIRKRHAANMTKLKALRT